MSNLRVPGLEQPWEHDYGKPDRIVSALQIMLDGPIGAAAFNNEFGRPAICGYFRTLEQADGGRVRGYHKPIMIAGGLGNIREAHVHKRDMPAGSLLVVLGGPAMLIGLGGGAASSMTSGASDADLDFASVQRDNAEMEHRCQEVIDRCWQLGDRNPDPLHPRRRRRRPVERAARAGEGRRTRRAHRPAAHSERRRGAVAARDLVQRGAGALRPGDRAGRPRRRSAAICERERCPFAVVGEALDDADLHVDDPQLGAAPVDLPLSVLFGKPPRCGGRSTRETAARDAAGA